MDPHQLEGRAGRPGHRHLPGIELRPFAAHGHQHQQRKSAVGGQAQHVDAVADAARLHQEGTLGPAQPSSGQNGDPFLLGGQRDGPDRRIVPAKLDQGLVAGIRHIGHLAEAGAAEEAMDLRRPGLGGQIALRQIGHGHLGLALLSMAPRPSQGAMASA
jgi:hypothetical protein